MGSLPRCNSRASGSQTFSSGRSASSTLACGSVPRAATASTTGFDWNSAAAEIQARRERDADRKRATRRVAPSDTASVGTAHTPGDGLQTPETEAEAKANADADADADADAQTSLALLADESAEYEALRDAVLNECEVHETPSPRFQRSSDRAVAELYAVGATPNEVVRRSEVFRAHLSFHGPLTPARLTAHWSECVEERFMPGGTR
jgi:hypothetical protein